jgi:hypothetical protein
VTAKAPMWSGCFEPTRRDEVGEARFGLRFGLDGLLAQHREAHDLLREVLGPVEHDVVALAGAGQKP